MYFEKNKFVMPSMQFFSHLSRTAHYATGTCEKQIVHNSRSIENVISCSNRMMSSVLFKKTPHIIIYYYNIGVYYILCILWCSN